MTENKSYDRSERGDDRRERGGTRGGINGRFVSRPKSCQYCSD